MRLSIKIDQGVDPQDALRRIAETWPTPFSPTVRAYPNGVRVHITSVKESETSTAYLCCASKLQGAHR